MDALDLIEIADKYYRFHGGQPAYHPATTLKLLFYGYCVGTRSSRCIEPKTYEDIAFRVLARDTHPDHSRISHFRKRHFPQISQLFVQVLEIFKESGLVKLGHVALDENEDKKYGKGERGSELPTETMKNSVRLSVPPKVELSRDIRGLAPRNEHK